MAGDFYTLKLIADIDDKKSDSEIQKYISEIQKKVSMDEKSKLKITVTPITERMPDPNDAKKYIDVQKDLVTVQATYNNQLGQTIQETGKFKVAEDGATESVKKSNTYVSQAASAQRNLATEMGAVIRRTLESAATLGLMYGALNQLRQGIEYIKELDKEMTNIQLVTGSSEAEINTLSQGYNSLAKEMGATTLEVAKGSLEFVRQGKSAEETAILIKNSMMMSKLGNMDAAAATDRMTSIMNGFKLEAEDTGAVLDKLIALDNKYATSVNEIATAMKYSSNSAQSVGIDLEHLAAYITVISSTTRVSAETIGQSLKTMTARFSDIKQGFDVGEGLDVNINNIEEALRDVNIPLRDDANSFRDMQDVLKDLGKVWDTLGDVQQKQIVKQFAGIRQREQFLVLMENQVEVEKAIQIEQESTNLATERYAIYLDSVEAAQNRMTSSWEKLAQSTISSGIVSGFYDVTAGALDAIDAIGGLPTVLVLAAGAYVAFATTVVSGSTVALFSITALQAAWTALLATNPVGWAIVAVGAIMLIANAIPTAQEKIDKLNKSIEEHASAISTLRNRAKEVKDLSLKYSELKAEYDKTGIASEEFLDVQNRLKDIFPELIGYYDEQGNFIIKNREEVEKLTQAIYDKIDAEKKSMQEDVDKSASARADILEGSFSDKTVADYATANNDNLTEFNKKRITEAQANYKQLLDENKVAFEQMGKDARESFITNLDSPELIKIFTDLNSELNKPLTGGLSPDEREGAVVKGGKVATGIYEGFSQTLNSLSSDSSLVDDLIGKSNSGTLGLEDAAKIPEEYLSALTFEGDKLKINIGLLKEIQIEHAASALAAIQSSEEQGKATEQQVAIVQFAYDQLISQSQNTFGQFGQTAWAYDELLWKISNDAVSAGHSFVDMEGNALNSAQSIYDYMSKSDANFNDFVRQAAITTGLSVEQIMQRLGTAVQKTYNYTSDAVAKMAAMINSVHLPGSSMYNIGLVNSPATGGGTLGALDVFTGSPVSTVGSYGGGSGGSGGGGGGGSSTTTEENNEAEILREIEKQIADARNDATKALQNQLKLYKKMVDEQKKHLDMLKEERTYQQELADQQDNVADIQNQISELSLDDSAEAQAQVLALQEQLADAQQELGNLEFEHGIDQQQTALDDELSRVESLVENAITAIEGIDASSLESFMTQLSAILAGLGSSVPAFHSGIDSGFVGGKSESRENEQFAKLLKGELVINPEQMGNFMNKSLPNIMSGTPSVSSTLQGMEIGQLMNFNISGNLDRNVLPNIEKIANMVVDKLNDNMLIRGTKRGAGLFSG